MKKKSKKVSVSSQNVAAGKSDTKEYEFPYRKFSWSSLPNMKTDAFSIVKYTVIVFLMIFGINNASRMVQYTQNLVSQADVSGVTLSMVPDRVTVSPGDVFDVNVAINSGDLNVTKAALIVRFDNDKLSLINVEPLEYLPEVQLPANIIGGTVKIVLGSHIDDRRQHGQLVKLKFRVTSSARGEAEVKLADSTLVTATGQEGNAIGEMRPSLITILEP